MLHYNPERSNYTEAYQYCEEIGAQLVEIQDQKEWSEVRCESNVS